MEKENSKRLDILLKNGLIEEKLYKKVKSLQYDRRLEEKPDEKMKEKQRNYHYDEFEHFDDRK